MGSLHLRGFGKDSYVYPTAIIRNIIVVARMAIKSLSFYSQHYYSHSGLVGLRNPFVLKRAYSVDYVEDKLFVVIFLVDSDGSSPV
mgnify:FL=1